jgi:hypothetical protein
MAKAPSYYENMQAHIPSRQIEGDMHVYRPFFPFALLLICIPEGHLSSRLPYDIATNLFEYVPLVYGNI